MTASFTPGPWFVRDFRATSLKALGWDGEFIDRILITNQDGQGIIDCNGEDCVLARITLENRSDGALLGDGRLADARLMAAAPDLYEACKLALGAFENNNCIDWDILTAAIAKAEGRLP